MPSSIKVADVWSSDMGAALSAPRLAHFQKRGYQQFVICPDGPRLDRVRAAGATWLPLDASRRLLDPTGDAVAAWQIVRYARTLRFDIVHTHNIKTGLIGRTAAGLARLPKVIHTMHGMPFSRDTPWPKRYGHIGLEWMATKFADRILVQSIEDRDTLLHSRVVRPEKVVRIGNGIDLQRFDPARVSGAAFREELGLGPADVLFLSAGRIVREKGFVELGEATALARARNPHVRVAVLGPRDVIKADVLTDEEMSRARAAGVDFVGERPEWEMPALYAAADAVILPSWREGLPRVLIEGSAMGKPLIATDVRGCREVVVAGRGGLLVPVRSPQALADAIGQLADDSALRSRLGAFNRGRALDQYDLRAVITRVERVYQQLLEHRTT
jgi:glycosyltransferase involved in cell wall biosynthesis